jgi:hypothetical protein
MSVRWRSVDDSRDARPHILSRESWLRAMSQTAVAGVFFFDPANVCINAMFNQVDAVGGQKELPSQQLVSS